MKYILLVDIRLQRVVGIEDRIVELFVVFLPFFEFLHLQLQQLVALLQNSLLGFPLREGHLN